MGTAANLIDDFPAEAFSILAFCDACDHSAKLHRDRLPPGTTIKALRKRLWCSVCGQRGVSIRIVYTGAGGFHYGGAAPTLSYARIWCISED